MTPASLASTHFFFPVRTVCVTVVLGLRLVVDFVTNRPEMAERFTLRVPMSHLLSCSLPGPAQRVLLPRHQWQLS